MRAVILAGGFGTRFRPVTFTRPKPMIPLMNKPIIEHVIDFLVSYGLTDIVVTTTYLQEMIMEYFRDREDLHLAYPVEPIPLGTAGSVKNAGLDREDEPFVVIQGDNITDLNLRELIDFHYATGGLVTIAFKHVEDPWHYGIALLESDGCISRFHEKPPKERCFSNLASTGIYVVEPKALEYVPEGIPFDFAKDLYHLLHVKEKGRMFGYVMGEGQFWADVGQLDGYMHAMEWMLKRARNDVIIGKDAEIGSSELKGPTVIGNSVVVEDNCTVGPHTVLFEDVEIGQNSNLKECLVGEGTVTGEHVSLREATIGAHCTLGKDVSVFNSTVWPFVVIPQNSTVDSTIKRFVRFEGGEHNAGKKGESEEHRRFLRSVSAEEAFYFNMCREGRVIHTGFVAHNLTEFLEIIKTVDQRSIGYHLGGAITPEGFNPRIIYNDFAGWIRNVIGSEQFANEIAKLHPEVPRSTLVGLIQEWLAELEPHKEEG
jgi:mannose-1-phosphate guanylyltransferase/phosphomannomutase